MRLNKLTFILLFVYLTTRLFIWVFRPMEFTEIIYSYMPYAHLWDSGEVPYLEQWYEYPPATIPLFYLPHLIDKYSQNSLIAINYLQAYRGLLFLIDIGLFSIIWKVLRKYQVRPTAFTFSVLYYCFVTAKAHHFLYDTMDITFAASMSLAVAAPILWKKNSGIFFSWFGTFLAMALKLVNAPLIPVYALLDRYHWKKALLIATIAGALVWAFPLLYFRSSLQVMFVYHQMRGLQVESVPAVISSVIGSFTDSEQFIEAYKNYEITGPVSSAVKRVFDPLFYLTMSMFVLAGSILAFRAKKNHQLLRHQFTLVYIFAFMLTAKVLSTPFLIWHIPLLAMYPFTNTKQQLKMLLISFVMIALSMTAIPKIELSMIDTHQLIGVVRSLSLLALLYLVISDIQQNGKANRR